MCRIISMPVAVDTPLFQHQLGLFLHAHLKVFANDHRAIAAPIIVAKNFFDEPSKVRSSWTNVPNASYVKPWFKFLDEENGGLPGSRALIEDHRLVAGNLQFGLTQVLGNSQYEIKDDDIIELLDCDMFHLNSNIPIPNDNEVICDDVYEGWHLLSRSRNKHLLDPFTEGSAAGGFVPIVARASTFRKIVDTWRNMHLHLAEKYRTHDDFVWWASIYSFNAACNKHGIDMVIKNDCYIPGFHDDLKEEHRIAHYSVDKEYINKHAFAKPEHTKACLAKPNVYTDTFLKYLNRIGYGKDQ